MLKYIGLCVLCLCLVLPIGFAFSLKPMANVVNETVQPVVEKAPYDYQLDQIYHGYLYCSGVRLKVSHVVTKQGDKYNYKFCFLNEGNCKLMVSWGIFELCHWQHNYLYELDPGEIAEVDMVFDEPPVWSKSSPLVKVFNKDIELNEDIGVQSFPDVVISRKDYWVKSSFGCPGPVPLSAKNKTIDDEE